MDYQDKVWRFLRLQNRKEGFTKEEGTEIESDTKKPIIQRKGEAVQTSPNEEKENRASSCIDEDKLSTRRSRIIRSRESHNYLDTEDCNTGRQKSSDVCDTSRQETADSCNNSGQKTADTCDNSEQERAVIGDTISQRNTSENVSIPNKKENLEIKPIGLHSTCRDFYENLNESYQKTMSHFDNFADNLKRIIQIQTNKPKIKRNKNDNDTKKRRVKRKIIEDRNISTLRYPNLEPGVVELIPNSEVYVSEEDLNECKKYYESCLHFARCLLHIIFTQDALMECSLLPNPCGGINSRPVLDCKAIEVLIDYAKQRANKKGWQRVSRARIITSLKRRLCYVRNRK
ncbi:hypothetical protein HF086_012065 [Spodoptera exigua]|uniref:BEN domain-containing protein n=1 Tax=Spodoptera exigua TaxID=7107 RepID=A0A922MI86_SPOEX|nr:hypothetical protein HF086_012065 [Spodoptera exigua]